jgi:hypothetical protein
VLPSEGNCFSSEDNFFCSEMIFSFFDVNFFKSCFVLFSYFNKKFITNLKFLKSWQFNSLK